MPMINPDVGSVVVREVWADNLDSEFELISGIVEDYPFISMDTEFPGVIYKADLRRRGNPGYIYKLLKSNVDALSLIQLGLTLSDADGNLPDLASTGADSSGSSISATSTWIATPTRLTRSSSSVVTGSISSSVSWVTFHSAYDFGYLVKILTRRELPGSLGEFLRLVRAFFGERVYDVKHMMRFCERRLYGGLDRVARSLEVNREVGKCHQAGSDSLLTWQAFRRMRDLYFVKDGPEKHAGVLYGLEVF
ncbi:hypothetical protein N665_1167s0002 [Sinapis alba]|nr:hypothetical protein N665_1167s0002 [Sinapis alba]